jgi:hypothetical protein
MSRDDTAYSAGAVMKVRVYFPDGLSHLECKKCSIRAIPPSQGAYDSVSATIAVPVLQGQADERDGFIWVGIMGDSEQCASAYLQAGIYFQVTGSSVQYVGEFRVSE